MAESFGTLQNTPADGWCEMVFVDWPRPPRGCFPTSSKHRHGIGAEGVSVINTVHPNAAGWRPFRAGVSPDCRRSGHTSRLVEGDCRLSAPRRDDGAALGA